VWPSAFEQIEGFLLLAQFEHLKFWDVCSDLRGHSFEGWFSEQYKQILTLRFFRGQ